MATKAERDEIRKDPIKLAIYRRLLQFYWLNRKEIRQAPKTPWWKLWKLEG